MDVFTWAFTIVVTSMFFAFCLTLRWTLFVLRDVTVQSLVFYLFNLVWCDYPGFFSDPSASSPRIVIYRIRYQLVRNPGVCFTCLDPPLWSTDTLLITVCLSSVLSTRFEFSTVDGIKISGGKGLRPRPLPDPFFSISSSRFFNFSTCILLLGNQVRVTSSWGGWLTGGGPGELRIIDRWMIRGIENDWQLRRSVGASLIRSKLLLDPVQIPLIPSQ